MAREILKEHEAREHSEELTKIMGGLAIARALRLPSKQGWSIMVDENITLSTISSVGDFVKAYKLASHHAKLRSLDCAS